MEQKQLEDYQIWFDKYVKRFYGNDEFINENIKLKDEHSKRVCNEMRFITKRLKLSEQQKMLADVIALFHDIGRFEQFKKYKTYRDSSSVNHAIFGIDILQKEKILEEVSEEERRIIEKAIELHNIKELPEKLGGEILLQSKLIRDADKLDIYYIIIEYYKNYELDPDSFRLELELPDEPYYSQEVFQNVLNGQLIHYRQLTTWNDMKLCNLGWVYDINFHPTFERLKEKGYLQKIVKFLPQNKDIRRLEKKILSFVESRIAETL